jgi:FSR family fosmidomycin resistance protein-like MFS transporter
MEKSLWMIYTTHMFIEVYLLIQVALIPVIIREFQLSLLEASLVATVPNIVALVMNLPCGMLADRFSPQKLLFASILVEGSAGILVSQVNSFPLLVFGVSLLRVASPFYHISGLSQISHIAASDKIGRSVGLHNALGNLGSAVGVISLTVFLSTVGWRGAYLFWSFPILVWGIIIFQSSSLRARKAGASVEMESPDVSKLARLPLVFSSRFLILLAVTGTMVVGLIGSLTFMTTYFVEVRGFSEAISTLVFGLGPFAGIAGSLYGGLMAERLTSKKAFSVALLCCAIMLSALSLVSRSCIVALVYVLYSFFASNLWAPLNTLVAQLTPPMVRGLGYSVHFLMEGIFGSLAPVLAASVIEPSSVWSVLPFSAAFFLASLVVLQFLPRQ